MPPRQGPAASQPSCPLLLVLLFLCLLALDRVHASDSREDKLLRSDEVAPLCPCAADAAQIQKKQQVNLFMMSKNSRGASAILALAPLVRSHPNLNVSFAFIASLDNNGTFHSLDGAEEVQGDLWELCAIKHFQDGLKYLDFLVCFSQQYAEIPAQAVNCSINSSLDLGIMYDCVEGTEGQDLLSASIQSVNAAGLSGSESDSVIFINGKRYEGPSTRMSIEEAICSGESVVVGDDKIYEQWWFYFLLALGVVGGVAILIAGVITAYRVYVKCHRASDMWLNMIKSNPGNALDFADKVQDAMHRYDGSGGGLRVSRERGMEEGHAAGGGGGGGPYVYSAGGAIGPYSVNQHPSHSYTTSASAGVGSRVYAEVDHGEEEEEEDEDYYSSPDDGLEAGGMPSGRYYAEESPLLSGLGNTWSMGGVRD